MSSPPASVRTATVPDAEAIAALVRLAYRGDGSRAGWTTEADLVADDRIDVAGVLHKITAESAAVLLALDAREQLVGCCEVADVGAGRAYFGMFAIVPVLQSAGLGRFLLAEAEQFAVRSWGATTMEMTVIGQRTELIDWYVRRGYAPTGERRPFPYDHLVNGPALRDDLYFTVLEKTLATQR